MDTAPRTPDRRPKLNLNENLQERALMLASERKLSLSRLVEELLYRELLQPDRSPYAPLTRDTPKRQ